MASSDGTVKYRSTLFNKKKKPIVINIVIRFTAAGERVNKTNSKHENGNLSTV